ncbi:PepSY-associated TM helix domain-containing protein [Rhizosaccharibacter radicis]|uniref:PepSY domain-containing protein n=1 Tax=Rhizosaccharibacter radicis TaxID=2782605 RepID=A0ABT1VTU3_9PROT|nr:PepSY domain-containing protein [Acetobacteraceae bacterium KSS12]
MAWLHGWSGLLVGWILFAVFCTGTAALLRPELNRWARPEIADTVPGPDAVQRIVDRMQRLAPHARLWFVPVPTRREPAVQVFWIGPSAASGTRTRGAFGTARVDGATGAPAGGRDTLGGEFFYRMHFQLIGLPVLLGRWVVGLCTMAMLVAILSGIVTHRRIFADFFTFRPRKGQRSWLDGHVVAAVLSLPFHLLITYSGLVLLMTMLMPWGVGARYAHAPSFRAEAENRGRGLARPSGHATPLAPIGPMLRVAAERWGPDEVRRLEIALPDDAASRVTLFRGGEATIGISRDVLRFEGSTGRLLEQRGSDAVMRGRGMLEGLHEAGFATPLLRGFYVAWGLSGAAMVATGCVMWVVKRRRAGSPPPFGVQLVDTLNILTFTGLPVAMACFLCANRLLPVALPDRADWEVRCFGLGWLCCAAWLALGASWRRVRRSGSEANADGSIDPAWQPLLGLTALLFAALPVLDALCTDRGLSHGLRAGNGLVLGFDAGFAGLAATFGILSRLCRPRPQPWPRPRPARVREERRQAAAAGRPALMDGS